MNIKTKLRLGFGFLFLVVLSFGGISLYHIHQIAERSKVILKDNYKSLVYVNDMRIALDSQNGTINSINKSAFEKALKLEENNITENGEKAAVIVLKRAFEKIKVTSVSTDVMAEIRFQLRNIDELNMNAIVKKNDTAQKATEKATIYLGITAFVCFIIL